MSNTSRLADRVSLARQRRFVGRESERDLFQSAISSPELPFCLIYLYGPGGIGKTSLISEFSRICDQAGTQLIRIDGRNIESSPDSFVASLRVSMGLDPSSSPLQEMESHPRRRVLLVDTYELLIPLDRWLRESFLPELPDDTLVVLAGKQPPASEWRSDEGWGSLIRILPLRNLSPEESRDYLARRGVPEEQRDAAMAFTHGHPLALSLVADAFAQRPGMRFQPEAAPDVVKTLLEQFVQKVPGPAHRAALEACSLLRLTTEPLLAEMLSMPDSHELFEWLRELSFIESGPLGIFPHDLAREILAADLKWRNPDWHAELHHRARGYYAARLQQAPMHEQQRLLFDYVYLHRDSAALRPFFEWQESGALPPDRMLDSDRSALVEMVAKHEGEESARFASYWLERQPQGVMVFRDPDQQPAGFMSMISLHETATEERAVDPAVRAAWDYLVQRAPLRQGESATLFRFWMSRDSHQAVSSVQSMIFVNAARHYLTTRGLAFTFFPCSDPDFWASGFAYVDLARIPEADFEAGGRRYGVYGHDWRQVPPLAWLALLAEREMAAVPFAEPPRSVVPLVVLSRQEFETAVHNALHDFCRVDGLRSNPLIRSRVVGDRMAAGAGAAERVGALQLALKEAAEALRPSPRMEKSYHAIYHTYLHPAPTQERAAELLDLPFSTFRRHLKTGIDQITEQLWQWEIGGDRRNEQRMIIT